MVDLLRMPGVMIGGARHLDLNGSAAKVTPHRERGMQAGRIATMTHACGSHHSSLQACIPWVKWRGRALSFFVGMLNLEIEIEKQQQL